MDWWIGFSGFLLIVAVVILAVIIRIRIQNAEVAFVGDMVSVKPPAGTPATAITVSGAIVSDVLLPATAAVITIINPFTQESTIISDPAFPTTVPACENVPFEVVFVPDNVNDGTFFTDAGAYPIQAVLLSNGLAFTAVTTTFTLVLV